jgi:hypothetical protein
VVVSFVIGVVFIRNMSDKLPEWRNNTHFLNMSDKLPE